jgi:hypothetical protein
MILGKSKLEKKTVTRLNTWVFQYIINIIINIIILSSVTPEPYKGVLTSSRIFCIRTFSTDSFLQCEVVILTPNPQRGGPFLYPPETGLPSYTPGHWIALVPRGRRNPYPLTWAPEGISVHTKSKLYNGKYRGSTGETDARVKKTTHEKTR